MCKEKDIDPFRSEGDLNLSPEHAVWRNQHTDEETSAWLARDEKVFLHQALSTPCLDILESAKGSDLQNLRGERYLDFHGNSVHQVGYGHPEVITAIREQLESLPFSPRRFTNARAVELAEKLVELTAPGLDRVLFAPGGTSAIGIALKLARTATGRFKTISMWDSFHGASLDAISLGGEAIFRKDAGPLLPGAEHVPPPNPSRCPFQCGKTCNLQCANYVEYVLEKEGDVAAVIAETVSSVPCFPRMDYWKKMREACNRHGALLILDEIPHSLGRTGRLFAYEHYEIVPDILVLGKGLGGGVFPLAAIIANDKFNIAGDQALGHYTHEKNPVACAAGLATLQVITEENLVDRARELGSYVIKELRKRLESASGVAEIRGMGLLIGIELESSDAVNTIAERIMYDCLKQGLSFKISMGNVLTLAPPLNISQNALEGAIDILASTISRNGR